MVGIRILSVSRRQQQGGKFFVADLPVFPLTKIRLIEPRLGYIDRLTMSNTLSYS